MPEGEGMRVVGDGAEMEAEVREAWRVERRIVREFLAIAMMMMDRLIGDGVRRGFEDITLEKSGGSVEITRRFLVSIRGMAEMKVGERNSSRLHDLGRCLQSHRRSF